MDLNEAVITRRRRVPLPEPVPGDALVVVRQLDAALASAGFKLSRDLFEDLAGGAPVLPSALSKIVDR
jgi:hypothetical protein